MTNLRAVPAPASTYRLSKVHYSAHHIVELEYLLAIDHTDNFPLALLFKITYLMTIDLKKITLKWISLTLWNFLKPLHKVKWQGFYNKVHNSCGYILVQRRFRVLVSCLKDERLHKINHIFLIVNITHYM